MHAHPRVKYISSSRDTRGNGTKGETVREGASSFRRYPTAIRCKHLPIVRKAGADGCRLSKLCKLNIYIRSRRWIIEELSSGAYVSAVIWRVFIVTPRNRPSIHIQRNARRGSAKWNKPSRQNKRTCVYVRACVRLRGAVGKYNNLRGCDGILAFFLYRKGE